MAHIGQSQLLGHVSTRPTPHSMPPVEPQLRVYFLVLGRELREDRVQGLGLVEKEDE